MRKFLQWSLVTIVALILMAMVVGQILATTTGRAKDASVAVLKDKLARLEAERGAAGPVVVPKTAGTTPLAVADDAPERVDADALRARWIALFEKMKGVNKSCGVSKEVWLAATSSVIDLEAPALEEDVRETLLKYQACIEPTMGEMQSLRDLEPDLGALFDMNDLQENKNTNEVVPRLNWELRRSFWIDAALGDNEGVVGAFTSLYYLDTYAFRGSNFNSSGAGQVTDWILFKPAIENLAMDDVRWNRLHEVLKARRSQQHFLEQVRRDTAWIVEGFEIWDDGPPSFNFSDAPVTYLRTWAYPRLTPALFNHDFDRFNLAMDRLLDLAAKPYFEVKEDLEDFCEDFDVEPDIQSLKFTRGNPGWFYVLGLSRHEFERNARVQASIDVIRFAILLEKHKRETGRYPESLEVFAEASGGSIPVNPVMGDAYVYEQTENSFRLGYHDYEDPKLVAEFGLEPVKVVWWHDPLGYGPKGDAE